MTSNPYRPPQSGNSSSEPHDPADPAKPVAPKLIHLPRWQVLVLMVGFPVLYWLNSVTPWAYGLFVQRDHSHFMSFGISVLVLHWLSLATALYFVRQARRAAERHRAAFSLARPDRLRGTHGSGRRHSDLLAPAVPDA